MKYLIISLLLIHFSALGQGSFDLLRKAEVKYEKENLKKAAQLISKAEKIKDCTCGNCAITKLMWVTRLKTQIELDRGNYLTARSLIDSSNLGIFATPKLDSLLWLTYQMEYGKDSLSNMLDYGIQNAFCETDSNLIVRMFLPLPNNKTIAISPTLNGRRIYGWKCHSQGVHEEWKKAFITTKTYSWLKN